MTSRVQTLRSSTKGARPSGRSVGELYTNFPDQQIGVVGPSGNIDLLAIRNFSTTADYAVGDLVARGGDIYRAAVVVTAGPWNGTQWTDIVHETDKHHGVTLFDPSKSYLQGELVAQSGNIYRSKSQVPAGPFNAALWDDVTTHGVTPFNTSTAYPQDSLVANAGKIYRAKAAVAPGPFTAAQWVEVSASPVVTDVTAPANPRDGDLWWDANKGQMFVYYDDGTSAQWVQTTPTPTPPPAYTLPAATATTLGGVKATALTVGQVVEGVNTDGSLKAATLIVENIAALRALPVVAKQHVFVQGYYTAGDGGGGEFYGVAGGTHTDDGGVTLAVTGGAWKRIYDGALNVRWFGAKGDGLTDDSAAIQRALNAVGNGGAVYFPKVGGKNGTGPSYLVNTGLVLTKNDVSIFSDQLSEYSEGLFTNSAITMLSVSGYSLRLDNMIFKGNGSATAFGTASGVVYDRSTVGDAETYCNIDSTITNCVFFDLKDGVKAKGRNVFIWDNMFSRCKRAVVGELHTYGAGTVSEFRGWRILRNRFHSCGGQYIDTSTETLPATLAALDSWCIEMPITSNMTKHLEIVDNNADFCAGFYKGYLTGARIAGNQTYQGSSIFVYAVIADAANQTSSSGFVQTIENNSLNSRVCDQVSDRGYLFSTNSIKVTGISNLTIQNNVMRNALHQHLYIDSCIRLRVKNNLLLGANNLFTEDATKRECIHLSNCSASQISDNYIASQSGTVYSYGITILGSTGVKLGGNVISNADKNYNITATSLTNAAGEGLDWQTPTMANGYVLGAQSRGYRRLFNGMIEVDVELKSGADNVTAFTLPLGYRPAVNLTLSAVAVWTSAGDAYALIQTDGQVILNWNTVAASNYNIRVMFEAA